MTLIKGLIQQAALDLKAARILNRENCYSQSYFWFQQAVEKANKAFGLYAGILQESDLQKVSHDQFKMYRKSAVEKAEEIDAQLELFKRMRHLSPNQYLEGFNFEEVRNKIKEDTSFIDSLRSLDLVNFEDSDLEDLIRQLEENEQLDLDFLNSIDFDEKIEGAFTGLVKWLEQLQTPEARNAIAELQSMLTDDIKRREFNEVTKIFLRMQIALTRVLAILRVCGYITIQHSSKTRYPEMENQVFPFEIYTAELPLIKKQPVFMDFLERAIEEMKIVVEAQ